MPRELEPKLRAEFERRLAGNGLFASAVERRDPRLIFRLALESLVGVREKGGNNRGPIVELLQQTIGSADGEAWCMALVQSGLAFAEILTGLTSPIFASEHCLTVWNETPKAQRVKIIPGIGAICIWRHGNTTAGHTGVTISPVERNEVELVEGNTEAGLIGGKIEREGGGIYHTQRSIIRNGNMRVVGYLRPF